jgi:hypothetical protein
MFRSRHLLALCCLVLLVPDARAAGLHLRWDHCWAEGSGQENRVFACDVNSGSHRLVGSFVPSAPLTNVTSFTAVLDLTASASALPEWWNFQATSGCRAGALSVDALADPADMRCEDLGTGLAVAGVTSYRVGVHGVETARLVLTVDLPPGGPADVWPDQEYFAFHVLISNANTVHGCGGGHTPLCLKFSSLSLTSGGPEGVTLLTGCGPDAGSDAVRWQGTPGGATPNVGGCPALVTAARHSSWAQVKQLYR